jgi:hypothetical protein
MYPNQDPNTVDPNLNTAVGASEYLDQISAKPKNGKFLDKKMLILLGGLLVVIIIVVIVVASNAGKKTVDVSSVIIRAKTQYDNAMQVIKYGTGNLSSGQVARNNAIASLVVGTQTAEMAAKAGKGKMDKAAAAALRDPKAAQDDLKAAKDAGRLNSEYKDTVGLFIQDIIDTLATIKSTEGVTKEYTDMVAKYTADLEVIKERIEKSNSV